MTKEKFDRIYGDLKEQLFGYMKSKELTESNFHEHMYHMYITVRTQIMLLGSTSLTGDQGYSLMQLPDYVILKITESKKNNK